MTDGALGTPPRGRSLFALALLRLRRNRAAMASLFALVTVTLACLVGPLLSPHGYDQVYRSYVKVPPSLEPYPTPATLEGAMRAGLERARVELRAFAIEGDAFRATVGADRAIDPRVTRYIERIDEFKTPRVAETRDDGRTLVIEGVVSRQYFLMGTDPNGRDLLTRILVGGRISLLVGVLATAVSLAIGVTYGAVAGYAGGRIDDAMMRVVDVLYALPFIFLVILLVVTLGQNFALIFLAIGAIEWLDMARIVRGQTLALKRREYVEAARALGVGPLGILKRHVVPNMVGPIIVFTTLMAPKVILLESFLSFLGLGVPAPLTSWGALIAQGAQNIAGAPYLLIFPAAFFVATLFSLNFLGDGLRDAFDPRDR